MKYLLFHSEKYIFSVISGRLSLCTNEAQSCFSILPISGSHFYHHPQIQLSY